MLKYSSPRTGKVILVGAGPGDPDLLTIRAARALEAADVLFYDALVDPRVLALATRAAKFSVGKRAGAHSVAQEAINGIMVRTARAGRNVVRLKAGDPFVLGRGGEEVLALGAAGIEVEVVPGLSSALSGPLAAGIPVTHRGVAASFVVASAVPAERFVALAEHLPPKGTTLVVLMGLGSRELIRDTLVRAGFSLETPAAIVAGAHGPRAWHWSGTLDVLPDIQLPEDRADLPGIVVVGDVVEVGETMRNYASFRVDEVELGISKEEERRVLG